MSMLRLALLGLRGRRSTFAGAAVALFFAAVLVTACGVLLASALRSTPEAERYAGAPIVLAGQQTLHQRINKNDSEDVLLPERVRVASALTSRLADVPGVRSVVPDVSVRTQVLGAHGAVPGPGGHDTFAHGWSSAALTPLTLHAGRPPARPGEVVLDAGLARRGGLRVGARVRLGSTDRAAPLTVVGIADARPPLERQAAVFVSDAEAERLAGHPGRTDAIALLTERGADTAKVAAAARVVAGPHVAVLTGSRRGGPEFPAYADAREGLMALTGMFGALALVIALFVIAGTLGLAIQLREREIALLRAIAATPRQVRRMLRWEAVILALAASAAGYLPGVALAHELIGAFSARGLAPEGMQVAGGIIPPLVTVVASVLCALTAAWAGSRRASKVPPTRALQESAVEPRLIGRGAPPRRSRRCRRRGHPARRRNRLAEPGHGARRRGRRLARPRRCRSVPRPARGARRRNRARAPRGQDVAGERVPCHRGNTHRATSRRLRDDADRAERRDGLHPAVLRHDSGHRDGEPDAGPPARRPECSARRTAAFPRPR